MIVGSRSLRRVKRVVFDVESGVVDHADDDHGEGDALEENGGVAQKNHVGQDEARRAPSGWS